jgi:hypothetical protein
MFSGRTHHSCFVLLHNAVGGDGSGSHRGGGSSSGAGGARGGRGSSGAARGAQAPRRSMAKVDATQLLTHVLARQAPEREQVQLAAALPLMMPQQIRLGLDGAQQRNVVDNGAAAVASGTPPAKDSATSAAAPPPASDAAGHMRDEASACATAGAAARSGGGGDDGSDSDDHALLTTDYKSHFSILAQTSASQPRGRRRERSGDPSLSPKPSPKRATNEDRPRANVPSLGLGATVIIRAGPHHGRRGVIVDEIWGNEARIKIDGDLVEYATARLSWLAAVAEGGGEANAAAATTSDMDEDET